MLSRFLVVTHAAAYFFCMLMPNYYRQLGLYADATDAQVQRAVRRYWQRVARFRPAHEQQVFLQAAAVLSNAHLRATYDPAYRPAASVRETVYLRELSGGLRTRLHAEQARGFRLEQEVRRLRSEVAHALSYPEEMAAKRQERRHKWGWLAVSLLVWLGYGLLRSLADNPGTSLAGPPYEPVAGANSWLFARLDSVGVYEQAELMPQYPGGAIELRDFLRQQVYSGTSRPTAERLCATGQLRFVIDSTGRVSGPVQVVGVPAADSVSQQLLRQAVSRLPRLVPGYQRARPVAVRLTVPLVN